MTERPLTGKVALITGGGSGLGEATARALAKAGCAVACLDLRGEPAEHVARDIGAEGGEALGLACDVSSEAAVFGAVATIGERWGRLDIAVNCAATDHVRSVHDMTVTQWDQVIAVNLRGAFLVSKAAWPWMQRQRSGHIVNIASTAAVRAWGNASAYHASKWGLLGFSRGLGVEGRADNIRVTAVIPGGMRTHFFDRFPEQGIPMPDERNLQDPATVADTILFAVTLPHGSSIQEIMVTPITETSWP
jgi:NAD(P)-dependent dehydrogenase (short-subunit alcohol dehydrogenase family)